MFIKADKVRVNKDSIHHYYLMDGNTDDFIDVNNDLNINEEDEEVEYILFIVFNDDSDQLEITFDSKNEAIEALRRLDSDVNL